MNDKKNEKSCIIITKEIVMTLFETILHKLLIFEKEPQNIGLSQLNKKVSEVNKNKPSIKSKDVKLSDLMRRVS